jgi:hypothetical protein
VRPKDSLGGLITAVTKPLRFLGTLNSLRIGDKVLGGRNRGSNNGTGTIF